MLEGIISFVLNTLNQIGMFFIEHTFWALLIFFTIIIIIILIINRIKK